MSRDHEIIFYTDGRHSSVYVNEPPMDERIYTAPIDELVDLGIDTITYAVGDCRVLLYDTKAGERWGHNVRKTNHIIFYRAKRNLEAFLAEGRDPLEIVCARAHDFEFSFMPSLLLAMPHEPRAEVTNCRCSDFCMDHPEFQVGEEPEFPEARWDTPTRLSYSFEQVRENRLAVIRELVEDYESDGIELNLYDYVPFLARREIPQHTDTFTRFVREARTLCDAAAKKQGRAKRLLVRAAASLSGAKAAGIDIETMIRDGIVDTVLAMPPHKSEFAEPHPDGVAELVAAARRTDVKIVAAVSTPIRHDAYKTAPRAMQVAQAANAYHAGARGAFFATYYPGGYPYLDADLANLRFMGRPELLACQDKHFFVRQGPNTPDDSLGDYGLPHPLPFELEAGRPGTPVQLYVCDDVGRRHERGELARCELRVRLVNFIETDVFDLYLNDKMIPRGHQEWLDWTYSVRKVPGNMRLLNHYWITVDLMRRGPIPAVGDNAVRVDLQEHDPRVVHAVQLHDVELVVDYRNHRHHPRRDEWWSDPAQRMLT